ncbi:MAG: dephospho-CoA kinase [Candidatus Omnitrophota bacterium]
MKTIGLTGSFGTGKTFAASVFRRLGADVIDADRIAHRALKKGSPAYKKTVRLFGKEILGRNGDIDRKRLAGIVFGNPGKLALLNRIVHPVVTSRIKERISAGKRIKVIDAPLLIEARLTGLVDMLIVVKASRKAQIERCAKKFGMTETEITKRIRSQMPLQRKIEMADLVIDNSGTRSETRKQIMKLWRKVRKVWR